MESENIKETVKTVALTTSYADKLKTVHPPLPRIGKKTIIPRDNEKVLLLVYPKDEKITDSEEIKKIPKEAVVPMSEGLQTRAFKKVQVQKGGVVVESGNRKSAERLREAAARLEGLKVQAPKKILPRILIYDDDRDAGRGHCGIHIVKYFCRYSVIINFFMPQNWCAKSCNDIYRFYFSNNN